MHFARIAVATDFSFRAADAVERAARLASEHGSTLVLVRTSLAQANAPSGRHLAEIEEDLRARFRILVETTQLASASIEALARAAVNADLLVISQPLESLTAKLLRGSAPERLLRLLRCPILVVRRPAPAPYRKIVVGVGLTQGRRLVDIAGALGAQARIHVFHAVRPFHANPLRDAEVPVNIMTSYLQRRRTDALDELALQLKDAPHADRITISAGEGDPAVQLDAQQCRTFADLVVVGKRRRAHTWDLLFSAVADGVLAWCVNDVLLVPLSGPVASTSSAQPGNAPATNPRPAGTFGFQAGPAALASLDFPGR